MQAGLIYLVPHFHYDPVWLEDQRTYTAQAFDLVTQYLEAAERDPSFKFLLAELDYLQPYWNAFPGQRQRLRDLVAAGRLEVNAGYNQPNETSLHGEALLRNLVYGRLFQRGVLGIAPRTYLPLDVFGHCPQLPQVLRLLGFEACIFSKDIAGVEPLCRALGLDGSEIVQKHEHYWFNPQSWEELLEKLDSGVQPEVPGLGVDLRFIGMDMQPPPLWLLERGDTLAAHEPALRVGLPEEYLEAVKQRLVGGETALPVSSRDLAMYHPGTTVSRIELKIANRLAENALFAAERFCSIAWALGADYPHLALDKAWRLLMFGQHHDAITGTPCDISFLDLMAMYREALELARRIVAEVLAALAGLADTSSREQALAALVVFNPLPWARTDVCRARVQFDPPVSGFALRDSGRKEVACQLLSARADDEGVTEAEILFMAAEVPGLGYGVYHVVAAPRRPRGAERREADRAVIENDYYTVAAAAQAGGGLISLLDRRERRQILDLSRGHPGNEVCALGEVPDRRQPAWTVFTTGEQWFSKDERARVWVERGPVRERIVVEGGAPGCAGRLQGTILYRDLRRVEMVTTLLGYRGEHHLFMAAFPLAPEGGVPVFEERFGAVARRRSVGYLDYRTFQGQSISGCALLPAQNWVELGSTLVISARGARGRPGAAFSVGYAAIVAGDSPPARAAAERLLRLLATRGVTASIFQGDLPADADLPHANFRFSLAIGDDNPHARRLLASAPPEVREQVERGLRRSGYAFALTTEPPVEFALPGDGERATMQVAALVVAARDAAGADAALAQLEKEAAQGKVFLPAQCNAVGEAPPAPADYGVALLNRGNIGASVEAEGTLAVALMHTTAWPGLPWGEGKLKPFFVPEHRDHRFHYALYPHPGDWREGETARRACEFNQPLMAVQTPPTEGSLPTRHSFLSLQPAGVMLSALKVGGYPAAVGAPADAGQSLIVRVYEGHGQAARARLSAALPVAQAWRCDALEARGEQVRVSEGEVSFDLAPWKIESMELAVERGQALAGKTFGPRTEPVQPLHMRWWEHNLGPAPMGNQPVTVTMRGAPPMGATTRFTLTIANAMVDREATGVVRLAVPAGWTITPTQVPYRLEPAAEQDYEVTVIIPADAQPAYIRAEAEVDGQMYQEVLPVGDLQPVAASVRRSGSRIEVTLRNPNSDRMQGRVDIITPLEMWGEGVGPEGSPRAAAAEGGAPAQGFDLQPGEERVLAFDLGAAPAERVPDFWAYARIACHGHVQYLRA